MTQFYFIFRSSIDNEEQRNLKKQYPSTKDPPVDSECIPVAYITRDAIFRPLGHGSRLLHVASLLLRAIVVCCILSSIHDSPEEFLCLCYVAICWSWCWILLGFRNFCLDLSGWIVFFRRSNFQAWKFYFFFIRNSTLAAMLQKNILVYQLNPASIKL